jgi:hypothetical protein
VEDLAAIDRLCRESPRPGKLRHASPLRAKTTNAAEFSRRRRS